MMKTNLDLLTPLAGKIQEANAKLQQLEQTILRIGMPAGQELKRRVDALKIEEAALERNFAESVKRGEPDSARLVKIEALLHHIEREEVSVERAAAFLHQAAPSSMSLAVEAGAQVVDLYRRGFKKILGSHLPLGESVFVNHTHEHLTDQIGLNGQATPAEPPSTR